MPSMADELAALARSSSARRAGSVSQGLLVSSEDFMRGLSPVASRTGKRK
jgi:hypothetical protein